MTASRTRSTGPQLAHFAAVLLTSTMLSGVPQAFAQTLPTGGSVAAGSATIATPSNGALTVTQSSSSAVVNWQSFSVGQGNAVNFVQPSSTSAILNRVTGSATSNIAGQINANGQVYLVNPNGIAITSTGTVNAAGFVASTLGISDSDFMSGKRTFTGNGASASVSNAGSITIGRGGYAALLGGSVDNAGTITVPLGKVGLGSGEQATLDLSGDGFMQVAVPTHAAGTHALVSNSGRISANGGTVQLSAAAARDMARQAINMSGTIEARSVGGRNGAIILGGSDGAVAVSGKLNVASRKAKGGSIAVTGRDIKLAGATLDASGKTGGGSINIGGGRQGQGPLQRAETTSVDSASTIKANATQSGNGGNVVVWSDLLTTFAGQISARGGALSGNGGEAEVSGKAKLAYAGFTDLSATHGSFGTLLLDPYNVTISNGTDSNSSGFTAGANDSVISINTLQTALATANVTVSTGSSGGQAGDITVAAPLTWSANTLTLDAYHSIYINAAVTVAGTGGLTLKTNDGGTGGDYSFGLTSTGFTGHVDFTGTPGQQALTINGAAYTLLYSMSDLDGTNGALNLAGNYALAGNLDASGNSYTTGVIAGGDSGTYATVIFSGTFEGLGHTVANLTITGGASNMGSANNNVGLIGYSSGTIRDIGLTGSTVSGGLYVGGLVGYQSGGSISNVYATGAVSGTENVGGLVGENDGTISNAYATGAVIGPAYDQSDTFGGLVGYNTGSISNAYATGAVFGYNVAGGLVGKNDGSISNAYATGAVSGPGGYVGGLVGVNGGSISNAYATGAVSGYTGGGLAGVNAGSISNAYATGAVIGGGYAGGGLVGNNSGSISNVYSTGAVIGGGGALVGYDTGSISNAYATGAVSNNLTDAEFVGYVQYGSPVTNSFYDINTTGVIRGSGASGLTTAQFQTAAAAINLGSAFAGGAGLYPYLKSFFPNGVQAISGFAYTNVGTTPAGLSINAPISVTAFANGTSFGSATTGKNGYYYIFGAAGSITAGNSLVAYTSANATTGAANSAALGTATSAANQSGLNLFGNALTVVTSATTLSSAEAGTNLSSVRASAISAVGGDATASAAINAVTGQGFTATGASFTIDQTVDTPNTLFVVTTAAGAPITVANAITFENGGSVGLVAAGALTVNAPITVKGAGGVTLAFDQNTTTPSVNDLSFGLTAAGFKGGVTFANADGSAATSSQGGALAINGTAYTLLYNMTDVAGVYTDLNYNAHPPSVIYALAGNLDATGNSYTTSVIGSGLSGGYFYGTFEGLGHTIANLTIAGGSTWVGLINYSVGTVRDIGVIGGAVSGGNDVGGLVGYNRGTVTNVYATGAVSGSNGVGGLIGQNDGSISNAYATAAVSGSDSVGGLVGRIAGSLSNAYATGTVSGSNNNIGGLVGVALNTAVISTTYATGTVSGNDQVGGLVGNLAGANVSTSYATGAVNGNTYVGGIAGYNGGTISNAYATGAVGVVGGLSSIGGLVGYNQGTISNAYATGAVSGSSNVGGLVGAQNGGTVTNGYYDINTTGRTSDAAGATGLTTAQFQTAAAASNLGAAFAGGSGLYPYLASFFPNGVQAISGTSYADSGVTLNASGSNGARYVYVDVAGQQYVTTTGANGYYYVMLANGTLSSAGGGTATLAYTRDGNVTGPVSGATLSTATGSVQHFDIWTHNLIAPTTATSLSSAPSTASALLAANSGANQTLLASAAGSDTAPTSAALGNLSSVGYIATGVNGFNIDQGISPYGLFVQTASGPITVSSAQTLGGPINLTLWSAGALSFQAPVTVQGAGSINLAYDQNTTTPSVTDLSFAIGAPLTFTDENGYVPASPVAGQSLAINGTRYTLEYTLTGLASDANANSSGAYALANSVDGSNGGNGYTAAVIGGFSGTLEGLGNTVANLQINNGSNTNNGLVERLYSGGTVRDIGIAGGSVNGGFAVGSLVGYNSGSIANAYATAAVGGGSSVGGLVGVNDVGGMITNAFATGAVSGRDGGGLTGINGGTITNAYATGAVSGDNGYAGGFVGYSSGTITNAYATGAVSAANNALPGGFVALQQGGTISASYWNTETSGIGFDGGTATGLTTAQFRTSSAASNLGSAFAGGAGLYPYLRSFFPNGVQIVSGFAYQDGGVTPLASGANGAATVSIASNGQTLGSVTTGANGYYYAFMPMGALTNAAGVAAYTQADVATGAQDAVSYVSATPGQITNLDISGGWRRDTSLASSLTTLDAGFATTTSGTPAAGFTLPNRAIFAINDFVLDSTLNITGTLALASPSNVTQTAAFSAGTLILEGSNGRSFTLTNAGNQFGQFAASGGAIDVTDASSLTVAANLSNACGCVVTGVSATGAVRIATAGDLTLASGAAVSGVSPVLAAGGAFINNAGSGAVVAITGNWLIYSADPAGNTFGGLDSGNTAIWGTAADGTVTASGNRYVFSAGRTLTVTTQNDSKTYGEDITGRIATDYVIAGFDPGLAGVYLADTVSTAYSGTASVTSSGAAGTANVTGAPYAITAALGSLASSAGYSFAFANSGVLTVNQRAITVTANSGQSFTYGDTPTLAYTVGGGGLVNGDTLSGALAGVNSTSGVGTYAISQATLAASNNYTLTYVGANATVTARPITVTADAQSRIYGDVNPALTYAIGGLGLVNGDLLSGVLATDADRNSPAGRYAITRGSLSASANYAMTFVPGTLTVEAAINPSNTELASTVANSTPTGAAITPAILPVIVSPPSASGSANGSDSTVISADPRFDGVVICSGLNCVVAQ